MIRPSHACAQLRTLWIPVTAATALAMIALGTRSPSAFAAFAEPAPPSAPAAPASPLPSTPSPATGEPKAPEAKPTPASSPASAPARAISGVAKKRIESSIAKEAARVKFRGAILVSIAGEPVFKRGFGPRIPDSPPGSAGAKPIDADSIYEIASIAKPFTAIAILRLVEQKKLSLDDEATRWLSPAANPADTASPLRGITIRHLLSHSSGLDNDTGISPYAEPSRDAAVAKFLASKVQTKPGEKFAYNNAGYIMLAVILEKVSGKSFEQCMRDEVFTPAGMTSSGFPPGDTLDATQSVQRKPGITMLTHPWGWGYRGCGGILTTLNDLTKFDRALRDGKLLSPESIEVMSRPVVKAEGPTPRGSYALGWFVDQTPDGRARLWHSGGSFGVRANLVRIPESEVLIVALCDDTAEPFAMTTLAERLVLKELPRREAGTRPPSPGAAPVP